MKRIEVTIDHAAMHSRPEHHLQEVADAVRAAGYTPSMYNKIDWYRSDYDLSMTVIYWVTDREILFKKFDIGYIPKWKRIRELLKRKF